MMNSVSEDGTGDAIVYVPVPQRLLPTVYRVLAQALAGAPGAETTDARAPGAERDLIDLIVATARQPALAAERQPVALTDLYDAYRRAYPSIGTGSTRGHFDALVTAHCINIPARFPDATNRRRAAAWLSRPVFTRVADGRYRLLSAEEIARFHRCVEADTPLVYADGYDLATLVPPV